MSLFVMSHLVFSETTTTVQGLRVNDEYRLRFTIQRRDQNPSQTAFDSQKAVDAPLIQTTPRTTKNPTSGLRAQAIESRGGEAKIQTCGGLVEIANRSGECHEIEYDKDFLNFLQTQGLVCAREAGLAAFGFVPTKVRFRTLEGQVDGNRYSANGKVSTHAVGRAIDIFEVDIFNGPANNSIRMHKDAMNQMGHRTFYSRFGDCWKQSVNNVKGGIAGTCGSGCLDFNSNSAHRDHMHISLPPLNSNRSTYRINCT